MLQEAAGIFREYKRERDILLDRILVHLQGDLRVSAAWLAGSLGRGEGDELSDLDVWVAVKQEHLAEIVKTRREVTARCSSVILFVEAPQNAPAGGGYLAACYEAPTAPHLVDWYWLPDSMALPPVPMKLLFDRSGSEGQPDPVHVILPPPLHEPPNSHAHTVDFFWMMLLITAKHIARHSPRMDELSGITMSSFRQAADFVNSYFGKDEFSVPEINNLVDAASRLLFLRRLAVEMQAMMAKASEMGYTSQEKIVQGAFRYLDMVQESIQES